MKPISAKSKQADLSGNQRLFNLNHVSLLTPFRDPVITYSGFSTRRIFELKALKQMLKCDNRGSKSLSFA